MSYVEFSSDLPRQGRLVFGSAEEGEETMLRLGVNQRVRQVGRGPFRADLAVRTRGEAEIWVKRFSTAFSRWLEPPPGSVGLLVPRSASGRFLARGKDVGEAKLLFLPDGSVTRHRALAVRAAGRAGQQPRPRGAEPDRRVPRARRWLEPVVRG